MTHQLIEEAESFVTDIFKHYCNSSFVFHNLEHTRNVVARCREIADFYDLPEKEIEIVVLAAWFHDTGYLFTKPQEHEKKSVEIAREFLKDRLLEQEAANLVTDCILATKFPTQPHTLLEAIICDADTFHFGTDTFNISNSKVCNEFKQRNILDDDEEFFVKTVGLMRIHQFHTTFGKRFLATKKEANIIDLIKSHSPV